MESLKQSVLPLLQQYYGAENPQRYWFFVLTALFLMWLPKGTRRFGGIGFFVVLCAMFIWTGLGSMYKDFTPGS